jgi:hypothetical protein
MGFFRSAFFFCLPVGQAGFFSAPARLLAGASKRKESKKWYVNHALVLALVDKDIKIVELEPCAHSKYFNWSTVI